MTNNNKPHGALKYAVVFLVLIDALARPLYKPLLERLANIEFFADLERKIGDLPRPVILGLLLVPFAIAEPLKVLALFMTATGLGIIGIPLLLLSYLVSFVVVERIYAAGKHKLLTYSWFASIMDYVTAVRSFLAEARQEVKNMLAGWLARVTSRTDR